jgi:hypothetical protein
MVKTALTVQIFYNKRSSQHLPVAAGINSPG